MELTVQTQYLVQGEAFLFGFHRRELDPSRPFVLCLDSGAVQELQESTPASSKESHEELQLKVTCQAKESAGEKESGTKEVVPNSVGLLSLNVFERSGQAARLQSLQAPKPMPAKQAGLALEPCG